MKGFGSDNHSGVHPKILDALVAANGGHAHSYGLDAISKRTHNLFEEAFGGSLSCHYVFNGTAANVLALDSLVASHHSILCAAESHLNVDECGAPERILGSKLVALPTVEGRLSVGSLEPCFQRRGDQHVSQPGALSLTQATELGTVYSVDQLGALVEAAHGKDLKVHLDGARLVNAAASLGCQLGDLTRSLGVDAVSFGGTKNGLMGGEAVIFFDEQLSRSFKYRRKQAMQLPSKTRFIAAQFEAFLKEELWRDIASHENRMARMLGDRLAAIPGITLPWEPQSNAVFAHIPKTWIKSLKKQGFFYVWERSTNLVRLMTSFDTGVEEIDAFVAKAGELCESGI